MDNDLPCEDYYMPDKTDIPDIFKKPVIPRYIPIHRYRKPEDYEKNLKLIKIDPSEYIRRNY